MIKDETVLKGDYNISKGTTDWQAFASFCLATVGVVPRIEPDGTADFYGVENDMKLRFSNMVWLLGFVNTFIEE